MKLIGLPVDSRNVDIEKLSIFNKNCKQNSYTKSYILHMFDILINFGHKKSCFRIPFTPILSEHNGL